MSKQKVGITSVPKIETNSMIRFTSAASVLLSIGVMKPLNIQNNIEDNTSFEFNNSEEFVSLKNLKGSSAQALLPPGVRFKDVQFKFYYFLVLRFILIIYFCLDLFIIT